MPAGVPDTDTFSLQDVATEVGEPGNLAVNFQSATGTFDPAYVGDKTNLLNFRNYTHIVAPVYDVDAQAYLDAAGITDLTISDAINDLTISLKNTPMLSTTLWDRLIRIMPIAGGSAASHSINLKDATVGFTYTGTVTHSATGMKGDGSTGIADTGFIPSNDLPPDTGISFSVYIIDGHSGASDDYLFGAAGGAYSQAMIPSRPSDNTMFVFLSVNAESLPYRLDTVAYSDEIGLFSGSKYLADAGGVNESFMQHRGLTLAKNSDNTAGLTAPIIPLYLLGRNSIDVGFDKLYSDRGVSFFTYGQGITSGGGTNLNNIIETFQTALGRNV